MVRDVGDFSEQLLLTSARKQGPQSYSCKKQFCHKQVSLEENPEHLVRLWPAISLISACETLSKETGCTVPGLLTYRAVS